MSERVIQHIVSFLGSEGLTASENRLALQAIGLVANVTAERTRVKRLEDWPRREIRRAYQDGISRRALARRFGVSFATVCSYVA